MPERYTHPRLGENPLPPKGPPWINQCHYCGADFTQLIAPDRCPHCLATSFERWPRPGSALMGVDEDAKDDVL